MKPLRCGGFTITFKTHHIRLYINYQLDALIIIYS